MTSRVQGSVRVITCHQLTNVYYTSTCAFHITSILSIGAACFTSGQGFSEVDGSWRRESFQQTLTNSSEIILSIGLFITLNSRLSNSCYKKILIFMVRNIGIEPVLFCIYNCI